MMTMTIDELYHHGILGQKWGVRRYQNPDGTLTKLGKDRYYTDDDSKANYEKAKHEVKIGSTYTTSSAKVDGRYIKNPDITDASRFLSGQVEALTTEFDSICEQTGDHYKNLQTNDQFKKQVMDALKRDYGSGASIDDKDYFSWDVEDYVSEYERQYRSDQLSKSWNIFTDGVDTYYDNVKSITNDIVGTYGNMPVSKSTSIKRTGLFSAKTITKDHSYSDVISSSLLNGSDASWVRYLFNHQELADCEGRGLEEREKLVDMITEEFLKTT